LKKKKKSKKAAAAEETPTATETVSVETGTSGVPFAGQWGSASLGNEQRSEKFLRLMGGFKTNNLNKKDSTKKTFASTALSGKREERLFKGLSDQYDQAFETGKMKRGCGLGFNPDEDGKPSFNFRN